MTSRKNIDELLALQLFQQREYSIYHLEYEKEMIFYKTVQKGDIEKIRKLILPLQDEKLGKLSKNSLQNLKYHLVIMIAMITRFCIEGGMNPESAYTLSDIYIQQVDEITNKNELNFIHEKIILDYTKKMAEIDQSHGLSKKIVKTIDYIYDNIQSKISLSDIATGIDINSNYLCELFKKETGLTINNFIKKKKIEAAEKLLMYENISVSELADIFGFASASHFIGTFKKEKGFTPMEYKKRRQFTSLKEM